MGRRMNADRADDSRSWKKAGSIGPIHIREKDAPAPGRGILTKCHTTDYDPEEHHMIRFDPRGGLLFTSENWTGGGLIDYYALYDQEDPVHGDRGLPKVACDTTEVSLAKVVGVRGIDDRRPWKGVDGEEPLTAEVGVRGGVDRQPQQGMDGEESLEVEIGARGGSERWLGKGADGGVRGDDGFFDQFQLPERRGVEDGDSANETQLPLDQPSESMETSSLNGSYSQNAPNGRWGAKSLNASQASFLLLTFCTGAFYFFTYIMRSYRKRDMRGKPGRSLMKLPQAAQGSGNKTANRRKRGGKGLHKKRARKRKGRADAVDGDAKKTYITDFNEDRSDPASDKSYSEEDDNDSYEKPANEATNLLKKGDKRLNKKRGQEAKGIADADSGDAEQIHSNNSNDASVRDSSSTPTREKEADVSTESAFPLVPEIKKPDKKQSFSGVACTDTETKVKKIEGQSFAPKFGNVTESPNKNGRSKTGTKPSTGVHPMNSEVEEEHQGKVDPRSSFGGARSTCLTLESKSNSPSDTKEVDVPASICLPDVPSDASPRSTSSITLYIKGMTCDGCIKVVDRILTSFDEIESTITDLQSCTSIVYYSAPRLNLLPILVALDSVGMEASLESHY